MAVIPVRGKKRTIVFALVALFMAAGLGTAYAWWSATGTGTGTATTGQSTTFTITSLPGVGELTPGGPGQAVPFTVTNAGSGTQTLGSVTVTLADAAGVAWAPPVGCLLADYSVTLTTVPTYGAIAPGGAVDGTATVVLANTGVNQDACKGATVPLHFTAS